MQPWPLDRKIRYEKDLDPHFAQEISAVPGGERLAHCIQCGTCSATCPLSIYMDYTPRRIIAMTRAGLKDDVLRSFTIWLCASCYSCSVECPKQIKITDIMYTLKRRAIREGVYPRGFGVPVLAREFYKVIRKHGRNNEGKVILNLVFKTNPLRHMKKAAMGLRLFTRGRISIAKDAIKNKQELNTILQTLEASPAESLDQTTVSA